MAKCRVTFNVTVEQEVENVYLIGNIKELGEWNPENAVEAKYNSKTNSYQAVKQLEVGTEVEYKISRTKSWDGVEKGEFGSEVDNHKFVAAKGTKEEAVVKFFN